MQNSLPEICLAYPKHIHITHKFTQNEQNQQTNLLNDGQFKIIFREKMTALFIECCTTTFLHTHSWLNWVKENVSSKQQIFCTTISSQLTVEIMIEGECQMVMVSTRLTCLIDSDARTDTRIAGITKSLLATPGNKKIPFSFLDKMFFLYIYMSFIPWENYFLIAGTLPGIGNLEGMSKLVAGVEP